MFYTLSGIKLKLASIATLQYSFNIAFTIEDFSTQLAVRQNAVVAIVLCPTSFKQANYWAKKKGMCNNFQCLEIYVQANIASCVLGHPKCFRRPKTTYRYPTLQSRVDLMLLYYKYLHFMYKFYAPNNHINSPNFHS